MSDTASRAEAARRKILDSGDPELIKRLHLLEATAPARAAPQGQPTPPSTGAQHSPARSGMPGLLGLGLAAAGGAWLGTVLGGMALSREMEAAFAEVAEGMGLDPSALDATDGVEPVETSQDADEGFLGGFDDFFDV